MGEVGEGGCRGGGEGRWAWCLIELGDGGVVEGRGDGGADCKVRGKDGRGSFLLSLFEVKGFGKTTEIGGEGVDVSGSVTDGS